MIIEKSGCPISVGYAYTPDRKKPQLFATDEFGVPHFFGTFPDERTADKFLAFMLQMSNWKSLAKPQKHQHKEEHHTSRTCAKCGVKLPVEAYSHKYFCPNCVKVMELRK